MQSDRHPVDIIGGLKNGALYCQRFCDRQVLVSSILASTLTHRWPNSERLIAEAFDVEPGKIRPHATADAPPKQLRSGSRLAFRLPEPP
ncbi:helix-turn-helix domain-containing protein [Klebsiella michiganensis]|nr:helix-turn-helix domain-containing protein [Klebsiella michiganensis]MCW9639822.1 helix-turn-helix domain-containing protein [Klebsiella michiganensis]WJD78258.1 helix-turn-helix domain-containing protein [Klebsiella michiganensis]